MKREKTETVRRTVRIIERSGRRRTTAPIETTVATTAGVQSAKFRRGARMLLGWIVAAFFVWLAFGRVPMQSVAHAIATARVLPLCVAAAAIAVAFAVRIVRWWMMLRVLEPGLTPTDCARPYLVSIAVNNTVPLRAGDVLRVFGFRGALRSPPMAIFGTLLIERLLDLLVLLGVLFIGLMGLGRHVVPRGFLVGGTLLGAGTIVGLAALIIVPTHLQRLAELIVRRVPGVPGRWRERLSHLVTQLFASLSIVRRPSRALGLLALTVIGWGFEGTTYACVAWSLRAGGSAFAPWFALSTGTLATLIPSSPGYVGTFDYFAILGLTAYGAPKFVALTFALLVHLVLWLPVTVVGAALLAIPPRAGGARASRAATGGRPTRAMSSDSTSHLVPPDAYAASDAPHSSEPYS